MPTLNANIVRNQTNQTPKMRLSSQKKEGQADKFAERTLSESFNFYI